MNLLGFDNYDDLKDAHSRWVDSEIQDENPVIKKTSGHKALLSGVKHLLRRWKKPLGIERKVER